MDRITLQNYRCFGSEEQSARLAPLTLLVGPNSTGKTSFLALIRALWDVAFREVVPNFREHPYDLGSWDDIVYRPTARAKMLDGFCGGFQFAPFRTSRAVTMTFGTLLGPVDGSPVPIKRTISSGPLSVSIRSVDDRSDAIVVHNGEAIGERRWPWHRLDHRSFSPFRQFLNVSHQWGSPAEDNDWNVELDSSQFEPIIRMFLDETRISRRPFANAPVRSSPRRTYDPGLLVRDGEGEYIPSYLANLSRRNADEWQLLKRQLERFGDASELFDEIQVRSFGRSDGDPFQIQVRKHSGPKSRRRKGPWRNLIDVGYGVSQALPVLTELLRPDGPTMFLLQQPEVHLHPQAQAALGTLFCQVASGGKQIIIETHSDYIIDRVRMDVRDGKTGLRPEDVSILYFEPGDLAVKIHCIRIDEAGNVRDAPEGYRQFFTDEMMRSIGL